MAKVFKGKLPAGQEEISIVTAGHNGEVSYRVWDAGCPLHRVMRDMVRKGVKNGAPVKIEWVIVDLGDRRVPLTKSPVVRKLGEVAGIVNYPCNDA